MKKIKAILLAILNAFRSAPRVEPKPTIDEPESDEIDQKPKLQNGGVIYYVSGSLAYIEEGLKLVGNKEFPGSKSNPVYDQIYIDVSGKKMSDEVANCMYFIQAMLKRAGYCWINTGWAADARKKFKGWLINKDLKDIAVGDVVTKHSTVASSEHHVFFVLCVDFLNKRVLALEANASNSIKSTNWYPFDILRSCGTPIKK